MTTSKEKNLNSHLSEPVGTGKGLWFPMELVEDNRLCWSAKNIVILVEYLDDPERKRGCFATNQWFAQKLNISHIQVSKLINKAIETGWIEMLKFDGRRRYLGGYGRKLSQEDKAELNKSLRQSSELVKGRVKQKFIQNNNRINNNINIPPNTPQGGSLLGNEISEEENSPKNSPTHFENFWNSYPRKIGKQQAEQQFSKNLKKHTPETMLESAILYSNYCEQAKLQTQYIKAPTAFLKDYWNDEGAIEEWQTATSKTGKEKVPYHAKPSNAREKLLKLLDQEELFDDHGKLLTRNSGIIKEYLQTSYWNGLPKAVQEAIVNDQGGFEKMKKPKDPEPGGWKEYLQEHYEPTAQIQKCLDDGWKAVPDWLKKEIAEKA